MKRYGYGSKKIAFSNEKEFYTELNKVTHTRILHMLDDITDTTCTEICRRIYFETEINC